MSRSTIESPTASDEVERADNNFAREAARDAFGKNWIDPRDDDFRDRAPGSWKYVGEAADTTIRRLAAIIAADHEGRRAA